MLRLAEGERNAAEQLVEAAQLLDRSPTAFRLRYLQTLLKVSEEGSTVIFADPAAGHEGVSAAALHQVRRGEHGAGRAGRAHPKDPMTPDEPRDRDDRTGADPSAAV